MPKAVRNGAVVAESDDAVVVEGNHDLPAGPGRDEHLADGAEISVCGWTGPTSHHDVVADGRTDPGAARCHREPEDAAPRIRGWIAFRRGVAVHP